MDLTLALVLTAAGATGAAALITTLIQVLKSAIPALDNGKEKLLALVFSAIIVVLAVVDGGLFTLPGLFGAFVAWLAIAKLATGIYDEVTQQPGSFTADAGVDSP